MDDNWDRVFIIPFISLTEETNRYVVFLDAPGVSPTNIDIRLDGRELAISSRAFSATIETNGTLLQMRVTEHRIRLPGPVAATGPPAAEAVSADRLRVSMQKAEPGKASGDSALTVL